MNKIISSATDTSSAAADEVQHIVPAGAHAMILSLVGDDCFVAWQRPDGVAADFDDPDTDGIRWKQGTYYLPWAATVNAETVAAAANIGVTWLR